MKKLLAIGMCLMFLGCSESPVDENGRHIAEKSEDKFVLNMYPGGGTLTFHYIKVDGHEYLIMTGTHRSGLTHSPKCSCLSNPNVVNTLKAN